MRRTLVAPLALAACFGGALSGCIGSAQPPLPPAVAEGLADSDMRRLETPSLYLYYPEGQTELARRVATRLETCVRELSRRKRIHNSLADRKLVILMPDAPINNAFVFPPVVSLGPFSVVPTHSTINTIAEMGLPLDPSLAGCHEAVHYVHMLQTHGVWQWLGMVFGDLISPQLGLEFWFHEGLATYYETRLQPGIGRLAWPVWRGMFHAAFAGGDLDGGDLSPFHRPLHWGNHYIVGSHFIEFLVERYGEERLWMLIENQGRSFVFPLFTSLRFRSVYGKTLTGLFEEFQKFLAEHYPRRKRPAEQRRIRGAGENARYATAPDGSEALIMSSGDAPTRLLIYTADGNLESSQSVAEIVPPRTIAIADPTLVSGLSFTADGRQLYFVTVDLGSSQQVARLVRFDRDTEELSLVADAVGGPGLCISPDGSTYYYAAAAGDRHHLAALDLSTRQRRLLIEAPPRTYYAAAGPDRDGARLALSVFDGERFRIDVVETANGGVAAQIGGDGDPVYDGVFLEDGRILHLAVVEGRFQAHAYDPSARTSRPITDAPYLAFQARPHAGALRFLSRHGASWSVEEVALPAAAPGAAASSLAAPGAGAAPGPGLATAIAPPPIADGAPGKVISGPPPDAELQIVGDEPYSSFDHLFYPSLRALAILSPTSDAALFGLTLTGSDRLQFHRWALTGLYQPITEHPSGIAEYVNRQLAPVTIGASASHIEWGDFPDGMESGAEPASARRQRRATLSVGRSFRTTGVALGGEIIEDRRALAPGFMREDRRLAGPAMAIDFAALEATPFAGVRRGLEVGLDSSYYPRQWSTLRESFADVGSSVRLTAPLPLSARHTLRISARGRALVGQSAPLLQVGGASAFAELYRRSDQPDAAEFDAPTLPPQVAFFEPLRGFEDHPLAMRRAGLGAITYRYPLIIDYGFTSTFWVLPSFMLRQLDFELFGAGALDRFRRRRSHAAVGGAVDLGFSIGLVPLNLRYQLARRVTDDEALVHSVLLGAGDVARAFDANGR